jgi:hypothetical protein
MNALATCQVLHISPYGYKYSWPTFNSPTEGCISPGTRRSSRNCLIHIRVATARCSYSFLPCAFVVGAGEFTSPCHFKKIVASTFSLPTNFPVHFFSCCHRQLGRRHQVGFLRWTLLFARPCLAQHARRLTSVECRSFAV